MIKINVVEDFSASPYGRNENDVLPEEVKSTGKAFRETLLVPKLQEAKKNNEELEVNLTGYNRYGRSFIDEAFGGVIRYSDLTYSDLDNLLKIKHDDVPSIVALAWARIKKAAQDLEQL